MSGAGTVGEAVAASRYDGQAADDLARSLGVPRVVLYEAVGSTLDVAHELAAQGAPAGTLVVADRQTAGRGRQGRRWLSGAGGGLWLTLIERTADAEALGVLSLRVGLALATALDAFAGEAVRLKWPNDLHLPGGKLAGILVEARWREQRAEWVAIGVGINVVAPASLPAAGLRGGTSRVDVLRAIVPAIRAAASRAGSLDAQELERWRRRDLAAGRACAEPLEGVVQGIGADGALLVRTVSGIEAARSGSLVFVEESC